MGVRGKLVELLAEFYGCDPMYYGVDALAIAQHLIANGVAPVVHGRKDHDMVKVVRCKGCKYWDYVDCYRIELSRPEDFCSYGEREKQ